ncbi:putative membrane protein, required for N-linked glycosylation [Caldisphaera lagunensis DSM 15908]|uniref:dolichyl-phosphooligosaccharide-protein glycotransferase n=1 Tax=Caldisphaera lagunensis (strain DSM 15908 / JCM 11604 / ANMR 0165 / IC-154) TaxID=1056495 RepID=L0ADB6_CALLD|nr:STT3 domain-containing protein [Caldisphaera lagunensis]AFZ71045.1 putative membrane protein, required for N-linked glycosylation [Caldisphaera lagunensis DSM 15908]
MSKVNRKSEQGKGSKNFNMKNLMEILNNKFGTIIAIILAVVITAVTVYIRLIPAKLYGINVLNGNDPWILYWLSNYFYHNGFNLAGLKDVKLFWYPEGRNFLRTEYLGGAMIIAFVTKYFTSKFGLTVIQTLSLQPVFMAGLSTIALFFAIWKLTNSRIAGLVSSFAFAFYPGAFLFKAFADYPGKTNAGLAFFSLSFLFLALGYKSFKRIRSLVYLFVGGLIAGAVSWIWGGYDYITLLISLILVLDPFISKPNFNNWLKHLFLSIGFAIPVILSPAAGLHYFIKSLGLAIPILLIVYLIEAYMDKLPLNKLGITKNFSYKVHIWVIIAGIAIIGAAIYSDILSFPSRVLLALGVTPTSSVVALTVAEYSGTTLSSIFQSYGPVIFVSIIGLFVLIYYLIKKKIGIASETLIVAFFIAAFLFLYGNVNESYFLASANYFFDITAGITIGLLLAFKKETSVRKGKQIKTSNEIDTTALIIAVFLGIIILGFGVYYAYQDYASMQYMAPALSTGWMQPFTLQTASGTKIVVPINNAWDMALNYLKQNTSNNSLVISWWDYGYWITVNSNRTTVADGATLNGTQIQVLASILTGNEDEASALLNYLHAKPNNTYLLTYDVFVGMYQNSTGQVVMFPYPNIITLSSTSQFYAITYGMGDIAKSYQMLRIAYKVNPFLSSPLFTNYTSETTYQGATFIQFPGFIGSPSQNVTNVLNTLIYSMMLNGIVDLKQYGVFGQGAGFLENATNFTPTAIAYATSSGFVPQPITPTPLHQFAPVAIFVSNPVNINNGNSVYFYSVIVFLYKWIG